jgi:hypothetical protein
VLHYFISTVNNFSTPQPAPQVQPVIEAEVDPLTTNYGQPENQLNILTEIERTEAEESTLEVDPSISNLELSIVNLDNNLNDSEEDEAVTDEIDEIFEVESVVKEEQEDKVCDETIIYTDQVGNTFEVPAVPPCAAHDLEPGDEEEEFQIDENQEWTGENASTASLTPTPEDHEQFEKEQKEEESFAFDFSDDEDDDVALFF